MTNPSHKHASKSGWGGKREGAGRKPGPDASLSKVTTVVLTEDLINKLRELGGSKWVREQIQKYGKKADNAKAVPIAQQPPQTELSSLDLNRLLIRDSLSTLVCAAPDNSVLSSGIRQGDIIIVNSKLTPMPNNVVLVSFNSSYSLRRYKRNGEHITLEMDGLNGQSSVIPQDTQLSILGVVSYVIKNYL